MHTYGALRMWPTPCKHNVNSGIKDPWDHTEMPSPGTPAKDETDG